MRGHSGLCLVAALGLTACGPDDRDGVSDSGFTTADGLGEGTGEAGVDGDDGQADAGDDEGDQNKFDVGGYDPDGDHEEGCKKVDLLFVVDDSGSMQNNQQQLINSFPGFIQGMYDQLADVDGYHVGVVTTDDYAFNGTGCTNIGDLVTQTGGSASSNAVCGPYASQAGHMDETDQLEDTFSCAAQVGIGGSPGERPIDGIRGALDPTRQGPGGCNEGFLRDDALLVIVIITDEDDVVTPFDPGSGSLGEPDEWFTEIVDAKDGVETNVVMLSVIGPEDKDECEDLEFTGVRIRELTNMFTHGYMGSICAQTYDPFFADAVGMIESACDGFLPPG